MNVIKTSYDILEKVNADKIVLYNFKNHSPFYDFFIVASVNERSQQAAISYFNEALKGSIRHVEGKNQKSWTLIDMGDVVVHLFKDEDRSFYGFDQRFLEFKDNIDKYIK